MMSDNNSLLFFFFSFASDQQFADAKSSSGVITLKSSTKDLTATQPCDAIK